MFTRSVPPRGPGSEDEVRNTLPDRVLGQHDGRYASVPLVDTRLSGEVHG